MYRKNKRKKRHVNQRAQTANEFINVEDIRNSFLYGKDETLFCYIQIHPVSLDLLSLKDKKKKIKRFAAEFSSEKDDFKIEAISRPVDISRTTNMMAELMKTTTNQYRKRLLYEEIRETSTLALSGEVIQRQFYMVLWRKIKEDREQEEIQLIRRVKDILNRFRLCDISCDLAEAPMIIQLCNLFANPAYIHLENTDYSEYIPHINHLEGNRHEEK